MIDIAAHRLGVDPVDLRLRNLVPASAMPYATGTHTDGHPVVYDSGDYERLLRLTLERFLELASEHLEVAAADLTVSGDRVVARGAESRSVTLAELHGGAALSEEAYFTSEDMTFPYGVHCAAVEVDTETGAVDVVAY